jgi:hypothetical protein
MLKVHALLLKHVKNQVVMKTVLVMATALLALG